MIVLASLVACTAPEKPGPVDSPPPDTETGTRDTGPVIVVHTADSGGATGDTAVDPPVDCTQLVAAADITYTSTPEIVTEEDFDFDNQGYLIMQRSSDLQGIDRYGVSHPIAGGLGGDATGIRSTAAAHIAVAQPWINMLQLVDPISGGSLTLVSNIDANGLEAGEDGMIYVTENTLGGLVRMVDPASGAMTTLASVPYGNGIVLSPDEQTLYLTASDTNFGGTSHILSITRDGSGEWDSSSIQVLYSHPEYVGSLTMDSCANLYLLEYFNGRVFRMDPSTLVVELLVDFPDGGTWSAHHFSPGLGDWDVNSLYVTSRRELYEVPVGVPGSHVLTP